MPSILQYANTFHAYVFGTSFWYALRGTVRVIDPATVCGWFRPPVHGYVEPNDLELYTTRTDAFCLLALAAILLAVSDAVPLPAGITGSSLSDYAPATYKKPYARAVVIITMLHHLCTGIGAWSHWKLESHHTIAMDIGVYGNIGLVLLGIAALAYGLEDRSGVTQQMKKA